MHERWSSYKYYRLAVVLAVHVAIIPPSNGSYKIDPWRKCCSPGFLFNESFACVNQTEENETNETEISMTRLIVVEKTPTSEKFTCQSANDDTTSTSTMSAPHKNKYVIDDDVAYSTSYVPLNYCIEDMTNGTKVVAKCPKSSSELETLELNYSVGMIVFWGYQTYMTTNILHMVLCIIVVVIYLSVPELGRGLYNQAVLRHNVCLMTHGILLTMFVYCDRDHCKMDKKLTTFLWVVMQFSANTTVFWLNVICFDMTLAITRFRWKRGGPLPRSDPAESRRLLLYGIFAWGGAFVPAISAAICDYTPSIPKTFFLKPNYIEYQIHRGPSYKVTMYFFGLPLLTLLLNNVLFLYTTVKIIRIQRSTEIATNNQKNILKQKYFLFLRLYLLMGAPWFFGILFACLNELVVLKIFRVFQPLLWLLMLSTQKDWRKKIVGKFRIMMNKEKQVTTINI